MHKKKNVLRVSILEKLKKSHSKGSVVLQRSKRSWRNIFGIQMWWLTPVIQPSRG